MLVPSAQLEVASHFSEGRVYAGFCSNIKTACSIIRRKEGFLGTTTVSLMCSAVQLNFLVTFMGLYYKEVSTQFHLGFNHLSDL